MNLEIQMLAGKEAKTYLERFFKNLQPLGTKEEMHPILKILLFEQRSNFSLRRKYLVSRGNSSFIEIYG